MAGHSSNSAPFLYPHTKNAWNSPDKVPNSAIFSAGIIRISCLVGGGGGGEGVAKGFVLYLLDSPLALAIKYFKVFYPISVLVFVEQLVCDQNPCGINEKCKEIWAIGSLHRCESKFRFAACFGFESINV